MDDVGKRIADAVPVNAVVRSLGGFDLFVVVSAASREDLIATVLDDLGTLPGVRRTETIEFAGTLKHSYTWARVL